MIRALLTLIALPLALSACGTPTPVLPFYDSADFTPRWTLPTDGQFHAVREFALTDQENRSFTERELGDRVAIVNFFFSTCTTLCPLTIKGMSRVQQEFMADDDVVLLSHSVTPLHDSAAVLREFAATHGVDSKRWKLLTGSEQEIYDLGRHYYFLDDDQGVDAEGVLFTHTENLLLLDKERRIRGIYNGMDPTSIDALLRDVRLLTGHARS